MRLRLSIANLRWIFSKARTRSGLSFMAPGEFGCALPFIDLALVLCQNPRKRAYLCAAGKDFRRNCAAVATVLNNPMGLSQRCWQIWREDGARLRGLRPA